MKKRKFCILILIFLITLILTGCKEDSKKVETKKVYSELNFLENEYITIFNKFISEEYKTKENQIDWNLLKEDYIVLNSSIDVIIIDLASFGISSKTIFELENNFKELDSFIESNDIDRFMKVICDSYSLVSNIILDSVSEDDIIKQEKNAKSNLLYIGYYLTTVNKEYLLEAINEFQNNYSNLVKNQDYLENNSYKINIIFIDIQKLKMALEEDNFGIGKQIFIEIFDNF